MVKITLYVEADFGFVPPTSNAEYSKTVGLVIAVGADGIPEDDRARLVFDKILQPWTWLKPQGDEDILMTFPRAKNKLKGYKDLEADACAFAPGIDKAKTYLRHRFLEFQENARSNTGQAYCLNGIEAGACDPDTDTPNVIAWPSVLADAAQMPGAIGRKLGLLAGFSYTGQQRPGPEDACPAFAVTWEEDDEIGNKTVALEPTSQTGQPVAYKFVGDDAAHLESELDVVCELQMADEPDPLSCPSPALNPILDRRTGWVQLPKDIAIGTRDYLAEFPADVQAALDMRELFLMTAAEFIKHWSDGHSVREKSALKLHEFPARPNLPASERASRFADMLAKVFMRFAGPTFALGIPPLVEQPTSADPQFDNDTQRQKREDWVRKALLFDTVRGTESENAETRTLLKVLAVQGTLNTKETAYRKALLKKAEGFDRIFTPRQSASTVGDDAGSRLIELAETLTDLARDFDASGTFRNLAEWLKTSTDENAASSEDDVNEAIANVALDAARLRLVALRQISATMRDDTFHRRAIKTLLTDAGATISDLPQPLMDVGDSVGRWADAPAEGAAARSNTSGRALQDRLRPVIEPSAPATRSLDRHFLDFLLGERSQEALAGQALGAGREAVNVERAGQLNRAVDRVTAVGRIAILSAIAPYLDKVPSEQTNETDDVSQTTFEAAALLLIAREVSRRMSARVKLILGSPTHDEEGDAIRLEPPLQSERPEPVAVPVGKIENADEYDAIDFAGFGVLLRANGTAAKPWHCLTLAMPYYVSVAEAEDGGKVPIGLGHAPVHVVDQTGFSNWLMVNDGLPLTALPLGYDPLQVPSFRYEEAGEDEVLPPRIVNVQTDQQEFEECFKDAVDNASCQTCQTYFDDLRLFKLLTLKYGETTEYSFFVQKNNGFLPTEISESGDPALFRLPSGTGVPGPKNCPGFTRTIRVRHLRRTAVSVPRLVGERQAENGADPQSFSRKFKAFGPRPVDREEIQPLADLTVGQTAHETPGASTRDRERNALLLLAPPNGDTTWAWENDFKFNILAPTTTVSDYERWRFKDLVDSGADVSIRNEIVAMLDACNEVTRFDPGKDYSKRPEESREPLPDDPAVVAIGLRLFEVRLRRPTTQRSTDTTGNARPEAGSLPYELIKVDTRALKLDPPMVSDPAGRNPLAMKLLKRPVSVTIRSVSDGELGKGRTGAFETAARATPSDGEIEVTIDIAAGAIYQLDIVALTELGYVRDTCKKLL